MATLGSPKSHTNKTMYRSRVIYHFLFHLKVTVQLDYSSKITNTLEYAPHLGKFDGFPHFSIQNFLGPLLPRNAEKPSYGMLDVPVTN